MSGETDDLDRAAELQRILNESGRERVSDQLLPEWDIRFNGVHCVEPGCGAVMPLLRLQLYRIRCIDCQTLKEKNDQRK